MFRASLQQNLEKIFGVKKVTYNAPSDVYEQDSLFVNVQEVTSRIAPGKSAYARVMGNLTVYSHGARLPFGFFSKRIQAADSELTKDFFFFDLDVNALNSPARLQDISEIQGKFIFLYSSQYDPNQGELTDLELEFVVPTPETNLIDVGNGTNLDIGDGTELEP